MTEGNRNIGQVFPHVNRVFKDPLPEGNMPPDDDGQAAFLARLDLALKKREVKTHAELAALLQISPGTVSKWYNSAKPRRPSLKVLARMPRALGVSVDWLLSVPGALPPDADAVKQAVRDAIDTARDELREEVLAVFDRWGREQ